MRPHGQAGRGDHHGAGAARQPLGPRPHPGHGGHGESGGGPGPGAARDSEHQVCDMRDIL